MFLPRTRSLAPAGLKPSAVSAGLGPCGLLRQATEWLQETCRPSRTPATHINGIRTWSLSPDRDPSSLPISSCPKPLFPLEASPLSRERASESTSRGLRVGVSHSPVHRGHLRRPAGHRHRLSGRRSRRLSEPGHSRLTLRAVRVSFLTFCFLTDAQERAQQTLNPLGSLIRVGEQPAGAALAGAPAGHQSGRGSIPRRGACGRQAIRVSPSLAPPAHTLLKKKSVNIGSTNLRRN